MRKLLFIVVIPQCNGAWKLKRMYLSAAAIAATAALSIGLVGCASDAPSGAEKPLKLGLAFDVPSWDPAEAHVGHLLQPYQAVYDSLILQEPNGDLVPMLATDWVYDDASTALTVNLRSDVTFSDGAVFDAAAVKSNLEHFKSANGRQAAQLNSLGSVDVIDSDTVELHLTAPDPAFTYYLSQAAGLMGSPSALGTDGIVTTPVGTGPYVMDSAASQAGTIYTFRAREGYWNPDLQKFPGIEMRTIGFGAASLNALVSGQVDAMFLDKQTSAEAEKAGKIGLVSPTDWGGFLILDRDGALNPALADVRVRQALNYAFDRKAMVENILLGAGAPTSQVFGPDSGAFEDSLEDFYTYDPAKARELLAEAGYADGLEIVTPMGAGEETVFAILAQQLADVGITLTTASITAEESYSAISDKKFPLVFFSLFQGQAWVAINQMISTTAFYNPFQTTSPELQSLIEEVQYSGSESGEKAKVVNEYITENAWFVPMYRADSYYSHDPSIDVVAQIQSAVPAIYNFAPAK